MDSLKIAGSAADVRKLFDKMPYSYVSATRQAEPLGFTFSKSAYEGALEIEKKEAFAIKKYCNFIGYTDVEPYEVVRVISDKTVEIRLMDTKQIKFPQHFHVGGFSAHCADNHSQEYEYISNPENPVSRIRLGKNGWGYKSLKFRMADKPHKFYDYNF